MRHSLTRPVGRFSVKRIPAPLSPGKEIGLGKLLYYGFPRLGLDAGVLGWRLRNCWRLVLPYLRMVAARRLGIAYACGVLQIAVVKSSGEFIRYGLASLRLVTTAGVNYIIADMAGGASDSNLFKFHGIGTGSTAEAVGDTTLVTELTTQYNPDSTRATGTQANTNVGGGAPATATAAAYRTVATNTVDAAVTITEHGIFTQAATGGGTLLDRSIFTGIALANGDGVQTTFDYLLANGG